MRTDKAGSTGDENAHRAQSNAYKGANMRENEPNQRKRRLRVLMAKRIAVTMPNKDRRFNQKLMAIPLVVLLIKFIIISNIPGHVWLGSDGENYMGGLQGLLKDGYFSQETLLSYWPAGYPLLMYIFGSISRSNTLVIMAVLQSILYALACLVFVREIAKTYLVKFSFWIAVILAVNPTLSLGSIVIGYEIIPASIFLFAITFFIRDRNSGNKSLLSKYSFLTAILFSISCYVQPRFLLTSVIFFAIWAINTRSKKIIPIFLAITISITFVLPISLALRNSNANGYSAISTNLGITMNLGAGSGASGKYNPQGKYGVPCESIEGNAAQKDSHLTGCVIKWYLKNPTESLPLVMRKAAHFWSPWFGPEVAGSMNRNPWKIHHPFNSLASNSEEGNNLVYGPFGKFVSWAWMLGGLFLICFGFRKMLIAKGLVRDIGTFLVVIVTLNWLISVGTLGDHRQRLPIMTMSLVLQCVGALSLFGKKWRIQEESQPRVISSQK